jgi:SPOR domain
MNTRLWLPALVCASAVLSACSFMADSDWHKTTLANTIAAYETFLQEHPGNNHADNARGRILALRDEHAWGAAQASNSIASYEGYLNAQSGGVHVGDAKYQITALQRAEAWKALQGDPSAASVQAFLVLYPQGIESNQAREKLNEFYHLQLADSRNAAGAARKRAELQRKFGKELTDIAVLAPPAPNAPDARFQVISGPMSRAAANATCATLERAHQSCKLVQGVGAAAPPASLSATAGSASLSRLGRKRSGMSLRAAM